MIACLIARVDVNSTDDQCILLTLICSSRCTRDWKMSLKLDWNTNCKGIQQKQKETRFGITRTGKGHFLIFCTLLRKQFTTDTIFPSLFQCLFLSFSFCCIACCWSSLLICISVDITVSTLRSRTTDVCVCVFQLAPTQLYSQYRKHFQIPMFLPEKIMHNRWHKYI